MQIYDPNHPAAGKNGYVQTPNVNVLFESADMRQAEQSYKVNLNVIEAARNMYMNTLDILKLP